MRCSVSGRWLGLGGLAVLTACSASGSGSLGNGGGIADGAVSSRDARASDGATGADSGRPGATAGGRSDGGSTTKPDDAGAIPTFDASIGPRDGGTTTPGTDGGTTTPGADGGGVVQCGTREICGNGLDDNCNDVVDESCPCIPGTTQRCYPGDPARAGRGVCNYGMQTCTGTGEFGTYGACEGFGLPRPVTCGMGLDFRCTGIVDEGCECATGATRSCYTGRMGTAGVGLCRAGRQTCVATSGGSTWGMCEGEVIPAADRCDGMDRDCDGNPNTGCTCTRGATRSCYTGPAGTAGVGLCRAGTQTCASDPTGMGTAWSTCQNQVLPATDLCDGMDRDCDGNPNTGCTCTRGATRPCYTGPAGTQGVGICRPGTQTCIAASSGTGTVWGVCSGEQRPNPTEICTTSVDDNCNGMVNEGCTSTNPCPNNQPLCGGRCCTDNQACVDGVCVGSGQLRITLTWDRRGDLDLHVVPPCGSEIYYGARTQCGGTLDVDNCAGNPGGTADSACNGPENVFWTAAPPTGTYLICVNPWAIDAGLTLNYTVNVYRGTQLLRTWRGSRTGRAGYQRCARGTAAFVGDITI